MQTEFHYDDATVTALKLEDGAIYLDLECCTERDEIAVNVALSFRNIENLRVENTPATQLGMLEEDGELISYLKEDRRAVIVIEWNDFSPEKRRSKMVSYSFDFESFDLKRSGDVLRPSQRA